VSYPVGTSNLGQWEKILWAVESSPWPHGSVLDVGAGYGKGAVLMDEYLNVKVERFDCIEPDPSLRQRLVTQSPYMTLYAEPAQKFGSEFFGRYDLVLMADVIEHMTWVEGRALLDVIPGQVVVSTPVDAKVAEHADDADIPDLERHVAQWTLDDFRATGRLDRMWLWHERLGAEQRAVQLIVRLRPQGYHDGRG